MCVVTVVRFYTAATAGTPAVSGNTVNIAVFAKTATEIVGGVNYCVSANEGEIAVNDGTAAVTVDNSALDGASVVLWALLLLSSCVLLWVFFLLILLVLPIL